MKFSKLFVRVITTLKVMIFLFLVGIVILWILRYPGTVNINWMDYKVNMPVGVLAGGLFLVIAGVVAARDFLKWLQNLPFRTKEWLEKKAQEKIVDTLIEGLTAVAAGQGQQAERLAERVLKTSPENPIGLMIAAQGAFLTGNHKKARLLFDHMSGLPETAFLGLRGLIVQARHDGDIQKTYSLLSQALRIRPDSPWVLEQMVHLSVRLGAYDESLSIIKKISRISHKSDTNTTRQEALIYWLKAEKERKEQNWEGFLQLAMRAHGLAPEHSQIAVDLASALARANKLDKALKVLKTSYESCPNLDVGELYIQLKADIDSLNAYRTVEKLTLNRPDITESRFLLAQSALKAGLWGQARQVLGQLEKVVGHTQRFCALMAQLEEAEHPNRDQQLAQEWWRKASQAPKDDSWMCLQCHYMPEKWQVFCESCSGFDTIHWTHLSRMDGRKNPLLFGKPEDISANLLTLQG